MEIQNLQNEKNAQATVRAKDETGGKFKWHVR